MTRKPENCKPDILYLYSKLCGIKVLLGYLGLSCTLN